jgi:hypothetical protein
MTNEELETLIVGLTSIKKQKWFVRSEVEAIVAAALAAPPAGISPAVKTAVLAMGNAGALLSNCAFNLAQHKGNLIDQRTAETLDECRKGWDSAWSNLRAALSQGDVSGEGEGA